MQHISTPIRNETDPFRCADAFPEIERREENSGSAIENAGISGGIPEESDVRGFNPSAVSDLTFI